MYDFILGFVRHGSDYLLCAESPFLAGQVPPVPFEAPKDLHIRDEVRHLTRHVLLDCLEVGQTLFAQVFHGEVEDLFLRARGLAREQRAGLRILLKAWHDPEIHDLPWELLHDGRRFLAQSTETPVVRYLEQRQPLREFRLEAPLRVLMTTACPRGVDSLEVEKEEQRLRAALDPLGQRVRLVVEHQIGFERLRFLLFRARSQRRPFQVWHHAGHGHLHSGEVSLALTAPDGSLQTVKVSDLQEVLSPCEELRIAVLNACKVASAAGLATALANLNIPAVIGFREEIWDDSALIFTETLYQGLIETTLERAMSRARLELRDTGYSVVDWSYPLLFTRTTAAGPWF
jgi:hypothetical protein